MRGLIKHAPGKGNVSIGEMPEPERYAKSLSRNMVMSSFSPAQDRSA
jgi:hypothetical protein